MATRHGPSTAAASCAATRPPCALRSRRPRRCAAAPSGARATWGSPPSTRPTAPCRSGVSPSTAATASSSATVAPSRPRTARCPIARRLPSSSRTAAACGSGAAAWGAGAVSPSSRAPAAARSSSSWAAMWSSPTGHRPGTTTTGPRCLPCMRATGGATRGTRRRRTTTCACASPACSSRASARSRPTPRRARTGRRQERQGGLWGTEPTGIGVTSAVSGGRAAAAWTCGAGWRGNGTSKRSWSATRMTCLDMASIGRAR
mmetsp:Transcript_19264/g.64568  ORF Transcript_19264/g.64568 Transcript_19264/m.64568 type:complete len:260 (+) Transcript_19264:438-1217(+)